MSLPSGYTRLEYIESDNSSYLDTGVTMGKTDSVTLEEVLTPFGTSDIRYTGANGYMQIAINSSGYSINGTAKKALGTRDKLKCVYTPTTESLYINGALVESSDWSSYNGANVKIGLFKMGDAGNGWYSSKAHSGKCYGASITKNGVKVREFIPCKNANGIAGMWDEISSTFFQSDSSFAFTAGPEVKPDLTAHKTLINGTAYTVQGGKCMVNGTVYNILKGRTMIDGTGYDITFEEAIGKTWVINERLYSSAFNDSYQFNVSFVSNGQTFSGFFAKWVSSDYQLGYFTDVNQSAYNQIYTMDMAGTRSWTLGEAYRTITFSEPPTGDLLTWLQANAVQQ